jgi:hypothetical protein
MAAPRDYQLWRISNRKELQASGINFEENRWYSLIFEACRVVGEEDKGT